MAQLIKEGHLTVKAQTPSGTVEISGLNVKVEKDGESVIVTEQRWKGDTEAKTTILPPGSTVTIKPL